MITRAALLCSALSAPYYLLVAQREAGRFSRLLFAFIWAGGVASMLGGPAWGRLADVSSRRVMLASATASALLGATVAAASHFEAGWLGLAWVMAAAFFLLSPAHEGVRLSRQTYIVNIAQGDRRTDYVAVSNSAIGLVLLGFGAVSTLAASMSLELALLLLALCGFIGALFGLELPEAEVLE